MSKKLDKIMDNVLSYNDICNGYKDVVHLEDVMEYIKEAYIAGRDEATDFIKKNIQLECTPYDEEPWTSPIIYAAELYQYDNRDGYEINADEESILAAKTESSLQP